MMVKILLVLEVRGLNPHRVLVVINRQVFLANYDPKLLDKYKHRRSIQMIVDDTCIKEIAPD